MKPYYAVFGIRDNKNYNWLSFDNKFCSTLEDAQKHITDYLIKYLLDVYGYLEPIEYELIPERSTGIEPIDMIGRGFYHTLEAIYWIEKDISHFATMTIL